MSTRRRRLDIVQRDRGYHGREHHQEDAAAADHGAKPTAQHALEDEQRRQHEEGAEHVRVLEGPARALVDHEQLRPFSQQLEIARDREHRGDHRGGNVAAQEDGEPCLGIGRERRRKEDGAQRKEGGDRHPDHRGGLIDNLHQRQHVAGRQQQQQDYQWPQRRTQRQAGHGEQKNGREPDELVGARLDEDEGAGKAHQPEQQPTQPLDRQPAPAGRVSKRFDRDRHQ